MIGIYRVGVMLLALFAIGVGVNSCSSESGEVGEWPEAPSSGDRATVFTDSTSTPTPADTMGVASFLRAISMSTSTTSAKFEFAIVRDLPLAPEEKNLIGFVGDGERTERVTVTPLLRDARVESVRHGGAANGKGVFWVAVNLHKPLRSGEVLSLPLSINVGGARVITNRSEWFRGRYLERTGKGKAVAPVFAEVPAKGTVEVTVSAVGR